MRTCSVEGCDKKYKSRGFCSMHLARFYKYGDISINKARIREICLSDGCCELRRSHGLCGKHALEEKRRSEGIKPRKREFDLAAWHKEWRNKSLCKSLVKQLLRIKETPPDEIIEIGRKLLKIQRELK